MLVTRLTVSYSESAVHPYILCSASVCTSTDRNDYAEGLSGGRQRCRDDGAFGCTTVGIAVDCNSGLYKSHVGASGP